MPAGLYPAGVGPAGHAPVADPETLSVGTTPAATRYDGAERGYRLDTDGHWEAIHPVDQEVALACLIPLGTVRSARTVGHTFRALVPGSPSLRADALDRARQALGRLLARGDVVLDGVDVQDAPLVVSVRYRNLRSADPAKTLTRTAKL